MPLPTIKNAWAKAWAKAWGKSWGATSTTSAVVLATPLNLQLTVTPLSVVAAAQFTLNITVVSPTIYVSSGVTVYPAGLTMKLNAPEIIAFSTDESDDMVVIDGLRDDMVSMDGTQAVKLLRKTDNVVVSLTDGTATPENKIYTFQHALIRQIADRDNRAVKQLRLFMQSVQNDDFSTMDTIIELPMREDVDVLSGDLIQTDLTGTTYTVVAVDNCTLKTRWRIGARRLK